MPYVICSDCQLLTYSATLWASTDECPRCGALLPSQRRSALLATGGEDPVIDGVRRRAPVAHRA